ncbi:MAG: cation transporter [Acidimicrobiia bacterium]|nr:cation transporter [Acidimicrobiia bacterium]
MSQPQIQTFTVPGMSCGHCVSAVTDEVSAVDGVTSVEVDLDTKLVTVIGGHSDAIIAAIDEAGYDVAN